MSAFGTLALILPLLGSSARTDVGTGVDSTARAGLIPRDATRGGVPSTDAAVDLMAGARIMTERTIFRLTYQPRFLFQVPGTADLGRPLILQVLSADYQTALTRRTNFGARLMGSAGEVAYSYSYRVLGAGTGTLAASTIPLFLASGATRLDHRTGRRNQVSAEASVDYQAQPELLFGDTEDRALPTSLYSNLRLSDQYTLTLRDWLTFSVHGGYINTQAPEGAAVDPPGDVSLLGGSIAWRRILSRRSDVTVEGGSEFAYTYDGDALSPIPRAVVTHTTHFRAGAQDWASSTSGGVQGFFDQVSATYRSQGFVSWGLTGRFGRRWSSGLNVFGSTSLAPEPLVPPQFESFASLEQPNGFQISRSASVRFGARVSMRAAHLRQEADLPTQREAIAFFGFRYTLGTDRTQGAWLR